MTGRAGQTLVGGQRMMRGVEKGHQEAKAQRLRPELLRGADSERGRHRAIIPF